VSLRTPTLDLIATEYAEAVSTGEFERAEGWLAVAEFAVGRQRDRERRGERAVNSNRTVLVRGAPSRTSG
jgi:hypothetical protein